ncbi:MAG: ABC transporter permease [Planctomycetota bacterium]
MALVPLSYSLRSLVARRSATVLTVLVIGATVAVLAFMFMLQQGFATLFTEHGRDDVAVLLQPGSSSEGQSGFPLSRTEILIKGTPEFAEGADGQPLASAELFSAVRRFKLDGGETNVTLRGVQPKTFDIHGDGFELLEGRRFEPGADEIIVGQRLPNRIRDCRVDDVLTINTTPFRVVGVFACAGHHDSEVWADGDRLREALARPGYSRILAKLRPDADVAALAERLSGDQQVPAKAQTERAYLAAQTGALSVTLIGLGTFLAVLMGIAAVFTGVNAMLGSVTARTREIGILLSLGFRPWAVFLSFLMEAALLGVIGGLVGCAIVLPLNGVQTGTTNFQTFTEVAFAFRMTPTVLVTSVIFAVVLGLIGGAFPALRAARLRPTVALRRG